MEITDLTFFESQHEFRNWLKANHNKVTDLWIGLYKVGAPQKGLTYRQALDEALCFGWIDGLSKSVDQYSHARRFTPRKKTSIWSQVNIRRYCELQELGLVHAAGKKTFENRDLRKENLYSFEQKTVELDPAFEKKFKANKKAWKNFQSMIASYKKPAIWWVISAKQEATRLKRLEILIQNSEEGRKIPPLRRKVDE